MTPIPSEGTAPLDDDPKEPYPFEDGLQRHFSPPRSSGEDPLSQLTMKFALAKAIIDIHLCQASIYLLKEGEAGQPKAEQELRKVVLQLNLFRSELNALLFALAS